MSRLEGVKNTAKDDSGDGGKLLSEIETISKALYLDRNLSRSSVSSSSSSGSGTNNIRSKSAGKTHHVDPESKTKHVNDHTLHKDGKRSIWNWKALKAFSNGRNRKFNCCFSVQVHSIEGLPTSFDNVSVQVHWRRRDGELISRAVKVVEGVAEFEEKLTHTCLVYGSRSGPHHSAKYEAKHFLLYASVLGAQGLDLGKHRIDLTRLLPLTLEELEGEKRSGKWTTSFRLSGPAQGAVMTVSFWYIVVGNGPEKNQNVLEPSNSKNTNAGAVKPVPKFGHGDVKGTISRTGSLPGISEQQPLVSSRSMEDIKDLHEVLPISRSNLSASLDISPIITDEGKKLDVSIDYKPEQHVFTQPSELSKLDSFQEPESNKRSSENECEQSDFSVIERGIELTKAAENQEGVATKNADDSVLKADGSSQVHFEAGTEVQKDELVVHTCGVQENDTCSKESILKELESALNSASNLETESIDSLEEPENYAVVEYDDETKNKGSLRVLDDDTEFVANEFLDMLGIEHSPFGLSSESEPESPRERLLRQFEKEALASGFSLFDFDTNETDRSGGACGWGDFSEDIHLPSFVEATEEVQVQHQAAPSVASKTKAKILEDLETEALMREWGLDDRAFQYSPPKCSGGFGSPIDLPPEEPMELPPLSEGLGPFLQTKNGGFVRSMNPALFRNAKTGGSLIMQVSSPVVVPAEMGSDIADIMQRLASVGIEKLSMQANRLMPLEDITGKTMQQVAWEASGALEGPGRQSWSQYELENEQDVYGERKYKERLSTSSSNAYGSTPAGSQIGSEYVSLEDLAPLAMNKIEALSMEGLRIQSGVSEEDAPLNISMQSIGDISALKGKDISVSGSLGLEGTAGLQLLDIKDSGDDIDGLMGLSLTLDEWMRLDSGDIGDEDQISEQTSRILAAHHANSLDFIRGNSKGEKRHGKGRKCGLLGNNFTVALMVQLRDPLRDYEPVGAPMLALIQVERVFVPPKPRIYCKVSEMRNDNALDDDESTSMVKDPPMKEEKALEEEAIAQFQISEVRITGLKTDDPGKKELWSTANQQQAGSRWLIANGMGKSNKQGSAKGKAVSTKSATALTNKAQRGDSLWSISSRNRGGSKW